LNITNNYKNLQQSLGNGLTLHAFKSLPSTNTYLTNLPFSDKIQVCIAAQQTKGKGQYGRIWRSEKNASILLSIRQNFSTSTSLNGLSLVAGLAVVQTLLKLGVCHLKIKWPNDIYINDKKLAGILVENTVQGNYQSVVIGVGLNLNLSKKFTCNTPWINLSHVLKKPLNKQMLEKSLIQNLLKFSQLFQQYGFNYFRSDWHQFDYLSKKLVVFKNEKALCIGVDAQGFLQIQTKKAVVSIASSADLVFF
jgi:BirA family biotin operon repressor/biotin-[acetyl-CoA-carboxylase] ligase